MTEANVAGAALRMALAMLILRRCKAGEVREFGCNICDIRKR